MKTWRVFPTSPTPKRGERILLLYQEARRISERLGKTRRPLRDRVIPRTNSGVYFEYMRFQVPQNLDIPDTVFFGLSFKQILYLGGGLGFLLILYLVTGSFLVSLFFGAPVSIVAGLLAFFRLNNQPFIVILQSVMQFATKKRMYVWRQEGSRVYTERKTDTKEGKDPDNQNEARSRSRVQTLTSDLIFDDNPIDSQEPDIVL